MAKINKNVDDDRLNLTTDELLDIDKISDYEYKKKAKCPPTNRLNIYADAYEKNKDVTFAFEINGEKASAIVNQIEMQIYAKGDMFTVNGQLTEDEELSIYKFTLPLDIDLYDFDKNNGLFLGKYSIFGSISNESSILLALGKICITDIDKSFKGIIRTKAL